MIAYATPEDLTNYAAPMGDATKQALSTLDPGLTGRLLRYASGLIRRHTAGALYTVNEDGLPTDLDLRAAMREATCAQVLSWAEAKLTDVILTQGATSQAQLTSTSENGASLTFDTSTSSAARLHYLRGGLGPEAELILESAGLLGGQPSIYY